MGDTMEYWQNSGLLVGVEEEKKRQLTVQFDKLAVYLGDNKLDESPVVSLIFPVIRRLYSRIDKPDKFAFIVDVVDLFWDLKEGYVGFLERFTELHGNPNTDVDVEAEFVYIYCEDFI